MKLEEALAEMRSGKKLRHKDWMQGCYVFIKENKLICKSKLRQYEFFNMMFACLDGWEIHKDKTK